MSSYISTVLVARDVSTTAATDRIKGALIYASFVAYLPMGCASNGQFPVVSVVLCDTGVTGPTLEQHCCASVTRGRKAYHGTVGFSVHTLNDERDTSFSEE